VGRRVGLAERLGLSVPGVLHCLSCVEGCQSPRFTLPRVYIATSTFKLLPRLRIPDLCPGSVANLVRSDFSNKQIEIGNGPRIEAAFAPRSVF